MKQATAALMLVLLVLASLLASLAWGSEPVPFGDVMRVLGSRLHLGALPADAVADSIVWRLRLPRALLALVVGGGLSVVGVAMQTLVRNPLAEPYILGISGGASAGASLFFLGFLPAVLGSSLTLPLAAFLGGLAAIVIVFIVARQGHTVVVSRLLLAGVAVSSLMAAVTSFVTLASPSADKVRTVLFWLLGSLSQTRWEMLPVPYVVTALAVLLLSGFWRALDALLLGEEPAFSLGVPVERVKKGLVVLAALVTGTLVAASGAIGFVGLIVPHAVRSLAGVSHRRLVPFSFMAGGVFLLWADILARTAIEGSELPVGVVTALCGAPFFLALLRRGQYRFG